ncbi:2Fe-2S iron-sulfur cluster-binding protein [Streptomyces roseus]|uniref:2Fe-2S iron-sulfur cluster-binding protein n=1 Tax=Streptomyces roseus TaxID=66430 RepID=UPI00069E2EE7|nr:2Fe-2S iron-sulfur cluster-binding protein [Streptomyces roseus]
MSENENVNGVNGVGGVGGTTGEAGPEGHAGTGWGWEPVPQGGEYDSDATAFVKLPQDMLDALGTGEPLAAPGHGYVPPPMIVPLGSGSADPAATGTWTMPAQWPEAGTAARGGPGTAGAPAGAPTPAPVGGPIPASIPLPASVAAAFGGAAQDSGAGAGAGAASGSAGGAHDPGATAEWRFPEAVQDSEPVTTGQWTLPELPEQTGEFRRSAPAADWSQAPATLPGGAAAPWATHPGFEPADAAGQGATGEGVAGEGAAEQGAAGPGGVGPDGAMSAGVLPEARPDAGDTGTSGAGLRRLGGPGVGGPGGAPRLLGGPGVGTLPEAAEPEPAHPAPHDIEAAHGAAGTPVTAERPHPGAEAAEVAPAVGAGPAVGADPEAERAATPAEYGLPGGPGDTDGHGFTASGHGPAGAEPGPGGEHAFTAEPAAERGPEPAGTDGRGFAFAEAGEPGTPGADTADIASAVPDAGGGEGFPAEVAAYEENATVGAVAHHEHPLASYVLRVNGADRPVTGAWIGESLLYVLRERLGLAGAKDGCSQGECGACAVQVDGRLVASCLVPAATAASSEVRTVEGLAGGGELSDVQQALCRSGAVQCGFCVPGMAMTIHDLLEGNHAPTELETRQALCGNLCRCSGYKGVIEAVREVVAERDAASGGGGGGEAAAPGNGLAPGYGAGAEARIPHQAPPGEGGIHHNGGMA